MSHPSTRAAVLSNPAFSNYDKSLFTPLIPVLPSSRSARSRRIAQTSPIVRSNAKSGRKARGRSDELCGLKKLTRTKKKAAISRAIGPFVSSASVFHRHRMPAHFTTSRPFGLDGG
jgi:hypothetical protein